MLLRKLITIVQITLGLTTPMLFLHLKFSPYFSYRHKSSATEKKPSFSLSLLMLWIIIIMVFLCLEKESTATPFPMRERSLSLTMPYLFPPNRMNRIGHCFIHAIGKMPNMNALPTLFGPLSLPQSYLPNVFSPWTVSSQGIEGVPGSEDSWCRRLAMDQLPPLLIL